MSGATSSTRITVARGRANLAVVARAALELSAGCYVWLERTDAGVAVTLAAMSSSQPAPSAADLEARFESELDRIVDLDRLEQRTRLVRSAVVGQSFAPTAPRAQQAIPPAPALDPETEAEIEKLLAEIESDDWLDDASEISKTWEERFGTDSKDGGTKSDDKKEGTS